MAYISFILGNAMLGKGMALKLLNLQLLSNLIYNSLSQKYWDLYAFC